MDDGWVRSEHPIMQIVRFLSIEDIQIDFYNIVVKLSLIFNQLASFLYLFLNGIVNQWNSEIETITCQNIGAHIQFSWFGHSYPDLYQQKWW